MSEAFFEKVDVFLPGQGETLAQAPAYHWERTEHATGHIYYSTREPKSVLIHLKGISREERDALSNPAMGNGARVGPSWPRWDESGCDNRW